MNTVNSRTLILISVSILFISGCGEREAITRRSSADRNITREKQTTVISVPKGESAREIAKLVSMVKSFKIVELPKKPGEIVLNPDNSLTIEKLRSIKFDAHPPVFTVPPPVYKKNMSDGFRGKAPYIATGIAPFRFKYFNCEFNFGGYNNFNMIDYASLHGFNIIYPYIMKPVELAHFPKGTRFLRWGGISWQKWFAGHHRGVPGGYKRYDLVNRKEMAEMASKSPLLKKSKLSPAIPEDVLMIDMEHAVFPKNKLVKQSWFPKNKAEQKDFIKKYYDGFAESFIAPVRQARKNGWEKIGVYGWAPFGSTWGGLENPKYEKGHEDAWKLFGGKIYRNVDVVYNSVYCFYWNPQNVAYTLANIDMNMKIINRQQIKKPLRPYYWPLLHGGGGGDRWWQHQPIALDEMRAMIAMAFFSGVDGIVCWSWSGTNNDHIADLSGEKSYFKRKDYILKDSMSVHSINNKRKVNFRSGDVIRILNYDKMDGTVEFRKIWSPDVVKCNKPEYVLKKDGVKCRIKTTVLSKKIRARTEPVSAIVEGLALIKPLEYTIRHGKVIIDVPSGKQFKKILPIIRRVKFKNVNIVITYDPSVVYGGVPKNIILDDFDGVSGRKLIFPADRHVRIFVLRDTKNKTNK